MEINCTHKDLFIDSIKIDFAKPANYLLKFLKSKYREINTNVGNIIHVFDDLGFYVYSKSTPYVLSPIEQISIRCAYGYLEFHPERTFDGHIKFCSQEVSSMSGVRSYAWDVFFDDEFESEGKISVAIGDIAINFTFDMENHTIEEYDIWKRT